MTYIQFVTFSQAAADRYQREQGDLFGLMFAATRGTEKMVDQYVKAYTEKRRGR